MRTIEEIDAELAACARSDPANFDAMEAHIDGLLQERCRAMGLAEGEEICRIELEIAAAANEELAEEIREFRRKVREVGASGQLGRGRLPANLGPRK
jgi:hypothetical protein